MKLTLLPCVPSPVPFSRKRITANVILIEAEEGILLVDTAFGMQDHLNPSCLMKRFAGLMSLEIEPTKTVIGMLAARGIDPTAVQHIVLSHLHLDHAGGLPDFPHAQVHVHQREYQALQHPRKWMERIGYNTANFQHHPAWRLYDQPTETWRGFPAIRLPFSFRCYLIELFGHTSGHCGMAIEQDNGDWWLYAGDAALMDLGLNAVPRPLLRAFMGPFAFSFDAFRQENPDVRVIAGHSWLV